jgi:hypothetical protein
MNLQPFIQLVTGESPSRAFDIGTHAARLAFGTNGFTGTLADKGDFVLIRCPKHYEPRAYAESLIDSADERIAEMWSPAGLIEQGPGAWWCFGFSAV